LTLTDAATTTALASELCLMVRNTASRCWLRSGTATTPTRLGQLGLVITYAAQRARCDLLKGGVADASLR